MRPTIAQFFRELGRIMSGKRPEDPSPEVEFNLSVAEEALHLAGRLKAENPEFNMAVLGETARLLNIQRVVMLTAKKEAA